MKILKKNKKKKKLFFFFLRLGIFFFKLGKKSPKSYWERGRISASEDTKKIPGTGPGINPWSTTDSTGTGSEPWPSETTCCVCPELIHLWVGPLIPFLFVL